MITTIFNAGWGKASNATPYLFSEKDSSGIELISVEQLVNLEGFSGDFHPIVQDFGSILRVLRTSYSPAILGGVIVFFLMLGCFSCGKLRKILRVLEKLENFWGEKWKQ